jgi:hypothetical protein
VGWFKVKTKGFIKPLTLWRIGGQRVRYGWMGRRRVRVRGVYRFSSLMKQNKKGKNCAVFCFAGFFFLKFLCYEVIVKQKIYKRSSTYYCQAVLQN